MKLNLVPARIGIQWVKLGITTFFKQPVALAGLFFMFMALMSLLSVIPVLGSALALCLLPAATLGLMAATQEASKGKFPMPSVLASAFRAGKAQARAMLVLGAIYAVGFLIIMALTALLDGGKFGSLYLMGGKMAADSTNQEDFLGAMLLFSVLYLPFSMMFWHAPALVYWHGVDPVKSLFFSLTAVVRNFWAFTSYMLAWLGVFMVSGLAVSTLAAVLGGPAMVGTIMLPVALLMAAMFFTSVYFTFKDSFMVETDLPNQE